MLRTTDEVMKEIDEAVVNTSGVLGKTDGTQTRIVQFAFSHAMRKLHAPSCKTCGNRQKFIWCRLVTHSRPEKVSSQLLVSQRQSDRERSTK